MTSIGGKLTFEWEKDGYVAVLKADLNKCRIKLRESIHRRKLYIEGKTSMKKGNEISYVTGLSFKKTNIIPKDEKVGPIYSL